MPDFTYETWCVLVVQLDEYTEDRITCKGYAAAYLAGFEALTKGALSLKIIPAHPGANL